MVRIAYLGNFEPPYSTENHVALSLESLGHQVSRLQEGKVPATTVPMHARGHDLFLWTQTYGLARQGGRLAERKLMLEDLRRRKITSVGFHLDRWWGLDREHQVREEPFFRVDYLFTADGGSDDKWITSGVNHYWSPPAVYHDEAIDVPARDGPDVLFVGAWREYGHREWWPHRRAMLEAVRERYGRRFECWPRPREEAVRGLALNELYRSAKVVIGDSCQAGDASYYWSDRVPETLGRGGFLIHPWVQGLEAHYDDGKHLRLYEQGNHAELLKLIDHYLDHDRQRESIRAAGAEHVRRRHTYRHRMLDVLSRMEASQ